MGTLPSRGAGPPQAPGPGVPGPLTRGPPRLPADHSTSQTSLRGGGGPGRSALPARTKGTGRFPRAPAEATSSGLGKAKPTVQAQGTGARGPRPSRLRPASQADRQAQPGGDPGEPRRQVRAGSHSPDLERKWRDRAGAARPQDDVQRHRPRAAPRPHMAAPAAPHTDRLSAHAPRLRALRTRAAPSSGAARCGGAGRGEAAAGEARGTRRAEGSGAEAGLGRRARARECRRPGASDHDFLRPAPGEQETPRQQLGRTFAPPGVCSGRLGLPGPRPLLVAITALDRLSGRQTFMASPPPRRLPAPRTAEQ